MGSFIFGVIIFALYFLPSIIGYKHRNANSICLLNLFLGWTLIGWVVAMIWAVSEDKKETIIVETKKSVSEQLLQLKELHEDGTLTKEEFEAEKKHLLRK
ncbi:Short C-terminal domain-containing protein [Flavobacterium psychrophilum DSM 3660]|uniref:superinfection immunity protein n=1 Tax=Flavobacterium psychrophilum TaxID=96345 RepID=UPI0004F91D9E|nr:superinfection immunity protein [Flavobacterium psychrophilum]AIN73814.1 hypothetical protein FPG3_05215 [Flavobacterium psychrophilum FPG3]MBF2044184.1 superinfection immunity protein [Flavobacterium psychrophilum]OXB15016.1 hypothetical protein B0A57_01145 [Flavobacterium psychrophilum DSM 3660 = ATCC 49418]SCY23084.1 Short C-terminal domain-containing protein [Flavobacterium psychrophilum DSM 3660] [Flavobacterium psychrophilum DSM 3660 = ATCC 49418]